MGKFMDSVTRTLGDTKMWLRVNRSEILIVTGLIEGGAALFLACRATLKAAPVIQSIHKENVDARAVMNEKGASKETKETALAVIQNNRKAAAHYIVKYYGLPFLTVAASATSILVGNKLWKKETIALGSMLAAVTKEYQDYRDEVTARYGKESDADIAHKTTAAQEEAKENGEEEDAAKYRKHSPYAICFCEGSTGWTPNADANKRHLLLIQSVLNERLMRNGHLFLNEAYDEFGHFRTDEGWNVGWIYDPKKTGAQIDLGLYTAENERFMNGYERSAWVDFNVLPGSIRYILKKQHDASKEEEERSGQ